MGETRGDRIKRLREARQLTQPALARLLISMGAPATLTKAAIHKWESGDTQNMQNDTFILLCQALGTDPQYVLWGATRTPPERAEGRGPRPPATTAHKRNA
jgi:transcriptional regulator with XRE-family HTH domain